MSLVSFVDEYEIASAEKFVDETRPTQSEEDRNRAIVNTLLHKKAVSAAETFLRDREAAGAKVLP